MTICRVAIAVTFSVAALAAQSERIVIRMVPLPNQDVRFKSTREMTMTIPSAVAVPGGGTMVTKVVSEVMLSLGLPDSTGRVDALFTVNQRTTEMTMNGQPMPGLSSPQTITAPPITFVMDASGAIVDVKSSSENALLTAVAKSLLVSTMNSQRSLTLAVGESTTVPSEGEVPMPVPGLPAAGPMTVKGTTTYTLQSITTEGSTHIAHLTRTGASRTELQALPGIAAVVTNTSDGTMDVDIERGVLRLRKETEKTDFQLKDTGGAPPGMPTHFNGVITTTSTGE